MTDIVLYDHTGAEEVAEVSIQSVKKMPEVVIYGSRIFVLREVTAGSLQRYHETVGMQAMERMKPFAFDPGPAK